MKDSLRHVWRWGAIRGAFWLIAVMSAVLLPSCKKDTPSAAGGAASLDLSTPKKAAKALAGAMQTGDMDTARKACVGTDEQFASVKGMSDMFVATGRFKAAVETKFPGAAIPAQMVPPDLVAQVEKEEEKIDGNTATLVDKDSDHKHEMKIIKDGIAWKVDLNSMPPEMMEMGKKVKRMTDAMDEVTRNVGAGKYKSYDEVMRALGALMGQP